MTITAPEGAAPISDESKLRDVVFISKATPGDDAFALWLAPRLEAAGYRVFADILSLDAGDRWRRKLTDTLQHQAVKMLLCCSDTSLKRDGVDEEISIANDVGKRIPDPNFIIPLRLEEFEKVFGIGGLQYIDFADGWAEGLSQLLDSLKKQSVPKGNPEHEISQEWERYQKRRQVALENAPEPLTSNWLRITYAPDTLYFLTPAGAISHQVMAQEASTFGFPLVQHNRGFLGFCDAAELTNHFIGTGRFEVANSISLETFLESGCADLSIDDRTAKNIVTNLIRRAWELYCKSRGLLRYEYASGPSFHVSDPLAKIGERIAWGKQGDRRSSMLRNIAKNRVWEFGVSAIPNLYPFPHLRLKSRVLFSDVAGEKARGATIADVKVQHRLRRSVCSPWRNPTWLGRYMAFLELLSQDQADIKLPLGANAVLKIDSMPVTATSPVSTRLPSELDAETEEADESTLPPGYSDEEEE
ncbi:MAG: hypothetical protein FD160_1731 [Caulobacteraceae bacterium]|nr:MAG: hypothetical protein FD160_1731 [Caulobacteraceae bacterium]